MTRHADQVDDELLVLRCQDGDAGALEALYRRWAGPLFRHAWRRTGSHDGAAEATQEAWLAIVKGLGRLDDPARFRAWAHRVVLNKSTNWVNARRRDREDDRSMRERDLDAGVAPEGRRDAIEAVRNALADLPPDRRMLLTLHYLDDLSVAEIADVLAIPVGTVKSRLHHARLEAQRIIELAETREPARQKEKS